MKSKQLGEGGPSGETKKGNQRERIKTSPMKTTLHEKKQG